MKNVIDEKRHRVEETRSSWGSVFDAFRFACSKWNSAWYLVEDRQAWKDEERQRLKKPYQSSPEST